MPRPRSAAASPAGVLRSRSACTAAWTAAGWSASTAVWAHRRAKASIVIRSISSASRSSAVRRSSRAAGSAIPGLAPMRTSRRTRSGSASATCRASLPPIEYPTSSNGSVPSALTSAITPGSDTGRTPEAPPCPRMSGATGR